MTKNLLFLLFTCTTFSLSAQDTKDFKTQSISIFKNSSAFFIKKGEVSTKDGKYQMINDFPAALFGTMWIHSPSGNLKHLSSYPDSLSREEQWEATNFSEMIELNKGKRIKLWLENEERPFEGMVESVKEKRKVDPGLPIRPIALQRVVTFKTQEEWLTFPMTAIRKMSFLEKPEQMVSKEIKEEKHVLQVDFTNNQASQKLEMMYLAGGIQWSPMYLLELESDTKAKLTLRAELKNDVEDIEDTELNFVVGVPNFRFVDRLSGLVDFLQNVVSNTGRNRSQNFSNALSTQSISYGIENESNAGRVVGAREGVEGQSSEDLYFYNLKNVSLKKGGRAHYQLFNAPIEIAHIYEANLPQNAEQKNYYQKEFLFSADNQNPVIHSVKLNNETSYPWTTGSVMVVNQQNGTRPISQDQLSYTSIKGNTFVKLTNAPDVRIKHAEKEIDRALKVKKNINNSNYYYDLVTIEGEVKIKNYKSKKIDLNIRRTIIGALEESSVKWLKAERVSRGGSYNKTTDVCWETSLEAGKDLVIKYQYKVYVPS